MTQEYHPECACQHRPLNKNDLDQMHANGEYEAINAAFAAGRFKFNDSEEN